MVTFDPRPIASMDMWTDGTAAGTCVIDLFRNDHCTVVVRVHGEHVFSRTCASLDTAIVVADRLRHIHGTSAAARAHAA